MDYDRNVCIQCGACASRCLDAALTYYGREVTADELLRKLKESGIHTAVDTCGFVPQDHFEKVLPWTDVFLYDLKAFDEDVHIRCTGQSNRRILDNLCWLDSLGASLEIRIPYVPEYNDNQMDKIAGFVRTLNNVRTVKVLPYHNYAGSKYSALGMKNTLPEALPEDTAVQKAQQFFTI